MNKFFNNFFCLSFLSILLFLNNIVIYNEDIHKLVSYTIQLILFILLMISLHELGHYIMGKILNFKLVYITSVLGMYTPYRCYFNVPMHLLGGSTLMYKPVHKGDVTKKELVLYALGGGMANLIFMLFVFIISFLFNFQISTLNYLAFANFIMALMTWIPSGDNDMGLVVKILKGNQTFTKVFNAQSMQSDPNCTSEEIIDKINVSVDPSIKSLIDLAKIEMNSRNKNCLLKIYDYPFQNEYKNNYMLWLLQFYQAVFKYLDTQKLTKEIEEILSDYRVNQYKLLHAIKQYIYTQDEKYIEDIDYFKFQMGPINNVKIINNIINNIKF